jgi:antitoxin CptB
LSKGCYFLSLSPKKRPFDKHGTGGVSEIKAVRPALRFSIRPLKAPAMTDRLKALKYRAHYRGTREADAVVGGFFNRYGHIWGETEIAWFEALVDADDEDIMAWALGRADPPAALNHPALVTALRRLDYIAAP